MTVATCIVTVHALGRGFFLFHWIQGMPTRGYSVLSESEGDVPESRTQLKKSMSLKEISPAYSPN